MNDTVATHGTAARHDTKTLRDLKALKGRLMRLTAILSGIEQVYPDLDTQTLIFADHVVAENILSSTELVADMNDRVFSDFGGAAEQILQMYERRQQLKNLPEGIEYMVAPNTLCVYFSPRHSHASTVDLLVMVGEDRPRPEVLNDLYSIKVGHKYTDNQGRSWTREEVERNGKETWGLLIHKKDQHIANQIAQTATNAMQSLTSEHRVSAVGIPMLTKGSLDDAWVSPGGIRFERDPSNHQRVKVFAQWVTGDHRVSIKAFLDGIHAAYTSWLTARGWSEQRIAAQAQSHPMINHETFGFDRGPLELSGELEVVLFYQE